MLRLENVPPEEMPQVVRIASELYEKDRTLEAEAQERQATVEAAEEVGLPEEYLHRAAAELHLRRIEAIERKRRLRVRWVATATAIAGIGTVVGLVNLTTRETRVEAPAVVTSQPIQTDFNANSWRLSTNPESQATVRYENGTAVVRVEKFGESVKGQYFVNLNTKNAPLNLENSHALRFRASGNGLKNVRLYLENSQQERWRSPAFALSGQEQDFQANLEQFDYQTRPSDTAKWTKQPYRPPGTVERLSMKFGSFVNEMGDKGEATLRGLGFE